MRYPTSALLTTHYALRTVTWPPYKRLRESHRTRRMRLRARMSPGCFHRFYQRLMRQRRRAIILPVVLAPRLTSP